MLKVLLLLFLFLLVFAATSVLSVIWRLLRGPSRPVPNNKSTRGEDMVRDPQCGMFLPQREAVSATIRGETHHFCSPDCRDRFRQQK